LDEVPLDRILEVVAPVELDRARDVATVVEIGVLVHLGDNDVSVLQVLGEPIRRDEHRLRIAVFSHQGLLNTFPFEVGHYLTACPGWTRRTYSSPGGSDSSRGGTAPTRRPSRSPRSHPEEVVYA